MKKKTLFGDILILLLIFVVLCFIAFVIFCIGGKIF